MMKRIMYTGIGLALNTRSEVESWVNELIAKGKISEKDGQAFMEELSARYDKTRSELESRIEGIVKTVLKKANVVDRSEMEELKEEIAALKQALETRDSSGGTP